MSRKISIQFGYMKRFIAIGNRIKELRGKISQREFAKRLEISLPSLQRYEYGERMPKGQVLKKIAQVCDVTVDYILTGDETALRRQLLKETQYLHAEVEAELQRMPTMLGEIDPVLEEIFPRWAGLSNEDKEAILQYVFYKKKVEKLLNKSQKEG